MIEPSVLAYKDVIATDIATTYQARSCCHGRQFPTTLLPDNAIRVDHDD